MIHTSKNRIAIFTSSMEGGGAQRSMLNLARGLAARGFPVDLLLARAVGPYLSDVPDSVRLIDLKCRRTLNSVRPLAHYLRDERPAALLSSLVYVNIVALWARQLAGVPVRLIVNEQNTLSRFASNAAKRRNRMMPFLARRFYSWADGIVAVSEGVRTDLSETVRLPHDRIDVIFNPSVDRAHVSSRAQESLDHPWFQSDEPPVVLAVGRLHQQKDYPTLVRAFAALRQRRDARLVILGEGEKRTEIEDLIRQYNLQSCVDLPGFADNPFAYMSRASLYALSSRWEGLPTVLVEALCCGTPVVATDCPSGPREILRDSRFGRLVPMGDPPALAAAMDAMLSEKKTAPPETSWAPFEVNAVVDRYLDILLDRQSSE